MKRARLTPRKESLGLGAALALLTGSLASAQQQPLVAVNISARPAASALTELAHQTGVSVLFSPQAVHGVQSATVEAVLSPEAAARALLAGTRLEVVKDATGTLVVRESTATAEQTGTDPVPPPASQPTGDAAPSTATQSESKGAPDDSPPTADASFGLEEVIVTAQKREESLQETPIAITAFTARELEAQRVSNVMDLLNKAPSVNLAPFAGTRAAPNLFIRAMGNLNAQTTASMATGIYIDGVPVGRSMGLAADIADLERVELLRGPQGTLWGRNTTAGAINFITRKPDDNLSFGAQLTAGSWDLRSGRLKVNVPVTDKLFVRASYMRTENEGWVDNRNTALPDQVNFNEDRKKEAVKVAVRFEPTEQITIDYGFDNSEMIFGNHFYQVIAGPTAVPGRQESVNSVLGLFPSKTEVGGHNLTLAWELDGLTIKSISGYRDLDSHTFMNYIDAFTQDNVQVQHQFSQELQVVGDAFGERLQYAAGLFYFEEGSREAILSSFAGGALIDSWLVRAEGTSAAIYGQATWTPPVLDDRLELTLGMRYTEDSRKATKTYVNPGFMPALTGQVVVGDRDFTSFNPAATVAYAFTSAVRGYAKYSTGYRAGGFNTQSTPAFFGPGFDAEDVKAWEVGLKSDLLQNRLRVNLAVFRNKYTDLQVDQRRSPVVFTDTLNAGSATVKGVELESVAVLGNHLSASLFYSWLDGEYGSYVDNGVDYAAARYMQNAPKNQYGLGLEYAFPHTAIGELSLGIDYRKQDESYANPMAYSLSPGYEVWNARLQLAEIPVPQGALRIAAWAKNLADEEYRVATTNLGSMAAQFGAPRSAGLDVIYEF
jgi:iron complex outermembrane receptor protein